MGKYLDENGLLYYTSKFKAWLTQAIGGKVDTVAGKGLSQNDYTDAEKTKLTGVGEGANKYVHPAYPAKATALYKLAVDATGHVSAASAAAKADLTALGIPAQDTTYSAATSGTAGLMAAADKAKLDAFGAAGTYALKSDVAATYRYKGSKATVAALPASGNVVGDVWNVETNGVNHAWTGTAWDALGGQMQIDAVTNAEIDAIVAS